METLTDGGFHNHRFRVRGAQAVSRGVNGLDPEHVACPVSQAVTHKPGRQRAEIISLASFLFISANGGAVVLKISLLDTFYAATIDTIRFLTGATDV